MKRLMPIQADGQRGFALVIAIFIVVVLALIGIMMVTIGGVQRATAAAAAQGTRAYYAARSGIEWGAFQALQNGNCAASTSFAPAAPGLNGFNVTVQCSSTQHKERSDTYYVYVITSTAASGVFGTSDYVSRQIQVTVTSAPVP
jgi:MSHA biogenesis protein MshP